MAQLAPGQRNEKAVPEKGVRLLGASGCILTGTEQNNWVIDPRRLEVAVHVKSHFDLFGWYHLSSNDSLKTQLLSQWKEDMMVLRVSI